MSTSARIGGTAWEQALYEHLTSHVDSESELLTDYQQAADQSHSAAFQYLVSLIVEEEARHHRTFADLAATLRTEVDRRPEAFAIPPLGHWGFERENILALTEGLLVQEQQDAEELRLLARELEGVKDTTMWHLLVELMQDDTRKHIRILEFVKEHAAAPA